MIKFETFYPKLRAVFAADEDAFKSFKLHAEHKDKIGMLLSCDEVKRHLSVTEKRMPKDKIDYENKDVASMPGEHLLLNPKSKKYPQMSAKLEMRRTKNSGRAVFAREKILPGIQF